MQMKSLRLKIINGIILCFLSVNSFGQIADELKAYKAKFSGENYVLTKHNVTVTIDLERGVPVVRTNNHDEFLILNQNGVNAMSQDDIEYSSFETIEKIEAYSLIPNGKERKKIKVTDFQTKAAETEGSVFHDDSKVTSFSYPSLCEGAIRVLDYTERSSENRFPFGFGFTNFIPIESATFVLDCDSSIHVNTVIYNDKKKEVKYSEELIKGRRIMTWVILNPTILKSEERAPNNRYFSTHLFGQIAYYNTKAGRVSVISNAKDLHTWYKTNIEKVLNEVPSDELKLITDSLVKGKNVEYDKVKAIYYWVQSNIKYIAFEEGINGFVPRQPNSIIKKRYGDCKDMASLLFTMLKYANIPSYLTWIGTRDLPYKYSEFPSSICDNHMITTYMHGDKPLFLDATCSFLPLDMPSYGIIGKEAFLHISENEYRIVNVPSMGIKDTYWIDTTTFHFVDKKIIGKNKGIAYGFYNVFLNDMYKNCPKNKLDELFQSQNKKGNNTFKVTNAVVGNIGNRDTTLLLDFDFEVNNYVTSYENEVYINMVLEKDISFGELKDTRKTPLYLDNLSRNTYVNVLEIPEGYTVKSIPKNTEYKSEFVDYSITYKQEKGKIIMTLNLDLKFLLLEKDNFGIWNEYVKVMKPTMVETVVLQKK